VPVPYWVVQGRDAFTVREGATWLEILPSALTELGLDLPRVRVAGGREGCMRVASPEGRVVALIHQGLDDQEAVDGALDRMPVVSEGLIASFDDPLPRVESTLPNDVAERLFELTSPLDEATSDAGAATRALELLLRIVPAEAGSVLLAGLGQERFEFLAAVGPAADKVLPLTLPMGQGHVGAVHDSGVDLLLHDVAHSARHWHTVDQATGFAPRSLVAVPLRSSDGRSWGVLELLSTDDRFFGWHVTAAATVATSLAERLAATSPA
jgi:hypothetical protein